MKKIFYSWGQVQSACLDISRQLYKDSWKPDYIVGLTRGGLIPATMLSHYLSVPMNTLKVNLRDHLEGCETNCWMSEDALGYSAEPKNILIVDDINDSGATIGWIKNDWQSSSLPHDPKWQHVWGNNVRIATLAHNLASDQDVDYYAWEINKADDNCWLVFPWEEWWK